MKDLFISFRTANQTYSVLRRSVFSLMHRAEAALFSILILCKLATNLLFVSLMQQVWSLTLRFAPMHYLSNSMLRIFLPPLPLSAASFSSPF